MRLWAAALLAPLLIACNAAAAPAPPSPSVAPADAHLTAAWVQPGSPPLAIAAFAETGLHPGQAVTIVASADSLTGFDCLDARSRLLGGSIPLTGQVSAFRVFTADASGTIRGAILLGPPPPSGIGCPGSARPYPTTALYTNGLVSDVSNRIEQRLTGQSGRPPGIPDH